MQQKKYFKKRTVVVLWTAAFILALAACQKTVKKEVRETTLHIVTMFGGEDHNTTTYRKINEYFKEHYPMVTLYDQSASSDEQWKASVVNQFKEGDIPDVLFFFTDAAAKDLVEMDVFVTVEEVQKLYPEYGGDILPEALESVKAVDGEVYALPLTGYYEGLFCNEDLFETYNVPLPYDWDSFLYAIEVFNHNNVIPVAVSLTDVPHYWIEHLILSEGGIEGHQLNPKDKAPESWEKGLAYFKTLYDLGAFPPEGLVENNDEAGKLFMEKKAAMQLEGSWFANGIIDKEHTTIVPFPVVPGGKKNPNDIITGFSSGFYITKKAFNDIEKRDAAIEFVMQHTQVSSISRYWWGVGMPAAKCSEPVGLQKLQQDGAKLAANADGMDVAIDSRITPEAYKVIVDGAKDIATGKDTAGNILEKAIVLNGE